MEGGGKGLSITSHPRPTPVPNPPLPRYLAKLSSVGSISEEETCEKLKGLIQRQVQMCKRNLEVMDSVRRGAQLAIEECQYQFRNRRWNCSTLDSLPVFGKVVTQGEGGARGGAGDPGRTTVSWGGESCAHEWPDGSITHHRMQVEAWERAGPSGRQSPAGGPTEKDAVLWLCSTIRCAVFSVLEPPSRFRVRNCTSGRGKDGRGKDGVARGSSEGEQQKRIQTWASSPPAPCYFYLSTGLTYASASRSSVPLTNHVEPHLPSPESPGRAAPRPCPPGLTVEATMTPH